MDATVVAAVIAAAVSMLTLAVTMAVQYRGYRATSRTKRLKSSVSTWIGRLRSRAST